MSARVAIAFVSVCVAACSRSTPPVADKVTSEEARPTSAAPSHVVDAAPSHSPTCEVEIGGTLQVPAKYASSPAPFTFVALDDCLGPSPKMAGHGGSTNGRFFVEVFVPWGSDLTLCAASEPGPGKPSTLYGKAKIPMHAEADGEVEFKDVIVALEPGPPKTFAHVSAPAQ